MFVTEIPGPTRKVLPSKPSGSDTNEVTIPNKKLPNSGGKESQLPPAKNSYQNPEYDDNYGSIEDDESDLSSGDFSALKFI